MIRKNLQSGWGKMQRESRGSALLITLLMLGILMTLTLGISNLVIREIRVTQSAVDANKAYYAAEAGVENALLKLKTSGEGAEPAGKFVQIACGPGEPGCVAASKDFQAFDSSFSYNYSVSNQASEVPGFDAKNPIFVETVADDSSGASCQISNAKNPLAVAMSKEDLYKKCPQATYRKLGLNQTQIIPLYSVDGSNTAKSVDDFIVEYYLNTASDTAFFNEFKGLQLKMFDVLRWKIYGKPKGGIGVQKTESIADFYPAIDGNSPINPVCIGTTSSITAPGKVETCTYPLLSIPKSTGGLEPNVAIWSAARECYRGDAGELAIFAGDSSKLIGGTAQNDMSGCTMRNFLETHDENYLVLTNMVNPNVVGITDVTNPSQLQRADIYYRVLTAPSAMGGGTLVKDYAEINSSGLVYKGDATAPSVVKDLLVKYKPPKFLEVFNFSLYKVCDKGYAENGICKEE